MIDFDSSLPKYKERIKRYYDGQSSYGGKNTSIWLVHLHTEITPEEQIEIEKLMWFEFSRIDKELRIVT